VSNGKPLGIAAVAHNPRLQVTRFTLFEWQTDPFTWIASG